MPVVRRLLRPFARYHRYAVPAAGFVGWWDLPIVGAVAFDDGTSPTYAW